MAQTAQQPPRDRARHVAVPGSTTVRGNRTKSSGRRRAIRKSSLSLLWEASPKLPLQRAVAIAVAGVLVAGVSASQQNPSTPSQQVAAQKSAVETVTAAATAKIFFSRVTAISKPAPGTPDADAASSSVQVINDPPAAQVFAASKLASFGWGQEQMSCLSSLWNRESSWQTTAENPSSLAYGIAQSLPAEKMASTGADYRTNYKTQITWGLGYIQGRYGSPCAAWGHSQSTGWY